MSILSFLSEEKHSLFKRMHLTFTEPSARTASFTLLQALQTFFHKVNLPVLPLSDWKPTTENFELAFLIIEYTFSFSLKNTYLLFFN